MWIPMIEAAKARIEPEGSGPAESERPRTAHVESVAKLTRAES